MVGGIRRTLHHNWCFLRSIRLSSVRWYRTYFLQQILQLNIITPIIWYFICWTTMAATPTTICVRILFFASAREAAGNINKMDLELDATDGSDDTGALRKILAEKLPNLASMVLDEDSITLALNEEYVQSGQILPLKNGDTVALIPPISGGWLYRLPRPRQFCSKRKTFDMLIFRMYTFFSCRF